MRVRPILPLLVALASTPARAHLPFFSEPGQTRVETAVALPDAQVSRVVYAELPCGEARWISLPAREGEVLYFQLGLPRMASLASYRPAVALVGPGLPAEADVPFDIPAGAGALVFPSEDTGEPEEFYEMFSNTYSWILLERRIEAPAAGIYSLVLYDPGHRAGRAWLAAGEVEKFDMPVDDLVAALDRVRLFHEDPEDGVLGQPCPKEGCATAQAGLLAPIMLFLRPRPRRAFRRTSRSI
jgi:hypothetical protein